MNRTSFLATLVGIAGISLSVHANEPSKKCVCKPGVCKKADCKNCKDCKCKAGKPSGHHHHGERHHHARLTPDQIKKLKAAKERYLREVAKIVGREKMEMWRRMQEQGRSRLPERRESGRPGSSKGRPSGSPNKVEGKPTRPNLRKPTKN